jgi:gamma-glutamylcyclotransferase (GGCT)/AIG2-like uncharacterized protein YtfP
MLYFAFGSNLDRPTMLRRCPGAEPVARATLWGHRLAFRSFADGLGVATVVREFGHDVHGAVYRVAGRDLESLDRAEGVPFLYHRARAFVSVEGMGTKRVMLYVLNRPSVDAAPQPAYVETILRGMAEWGLPKIGVLHAVAVAPAWEGDRHAV